MCTLFVVPADADTCVLRALVLLTSKGTLSRRANRMAEVKPHSGVSMKSIRSDSSVTTRSKRPLRTEADIPVPGGTYSALRARIGHFGRRTSASSKAPARDLGVN